MSKILTCVTTRVTDEQYEVLRRLGKRYRWSISATLAALIDFQMRLDEALKNYEGGIESNSFHDVGPMDEGFFDPEQGREFIVDELRSGLAGAFVDEEDDA